MTLLCFAVFLAAVAGSLMTGIKLFWPLLLGLILFYLLGLKRGFSPRELAAMAWRRGRKSLIVIQVFLTIGMVTALWRSSGTIAIFLYYGLRAISPPWFLLVAFLLSALLSLALGTSNGVCGTAGVVLIILARSGGVDLALTAGAVLSGAYFGDRCSPMSSCATLVAACTDTKLYANVREMLKTAALPTLLCVLFYGFLSFRNPITTVDEAVLSALKTNFSLHPVVLLPAVVMLALPLMRVPVKWAMVVSTVTAFILTAFLQGMPLTETLRTAVFGFAPTQSDLARILTGGGLVSMIHTCLVVFVTGLYAGILDETHILDSVHHLAERAAERLGLFPATCLVSIAIAMVFCNQSVTVMMGEQLMAESYRKRGASRTELAMDIANSGVMLSGLVPWSIALTVPLSMLGVGIEAAPYAALLYFIPLCYLFTKRFFRAGQNRPIPSERT